MFVAWEFYYLHGAMGQMLRITFNSMDYNYQILNTGPVSKETREIQVLLDGETYTLVASQGQWLAKDPVEALVPGLLSAIGRALASRYRI